MERDAEVERGGVIGQHRVAEAGKVGPDIDAAKRLARNDAGVVGGQIEADIEGLLPVHHAAFLVQRLRAFGGPAAIVRVVADIELALLGLGQGEERVGPGEDIGDQGVGDAMPRDQEKPGIAAGAAQIGNESGAVCAARIALPVENRNHGCASRCTGTGGGALAAIRPSTRAATRARWRARLSGVELSIR